MTCTGIDRLLADPSRLRGRRYGLLAHAACPVMVVGGPAAPVLLPASGFRSRPVGSHPLTSAFAAVGA